MQAVRPADEDRLPWLEPYRETRRPGRPPRGRGRPLAYGAGTAILLAVGAGGYWLGQRDDISAPPSPSAIVALPAPRPAPAPVQVAEAPPPVAEPEVAEAPPPVVRKAVPVKKEASARKRPGAKTIRTAGVDNARRPGPNMPSPGPAGKIIQLGAFTTEERAGNAYQARITRYPMLAGMPRVIVPVVTEPDRRVLYALRLGTTSRQQSKSVCRNLRRSGDHCLVIG